MTRTAVGFACSLLALLLPVAGRAASYRFVVLADSTSEVKPIHDKAPSIDEDGAGPGIIDRRLYVGPDAVEDRVIGRGDSRCDGVVSNVAFHRFGLNDTGEIALGVELSNARRLVVRAEPTLTEPGACITEPVPEPASGGAVAGAALARLAWRRRAGRH